MYVTTMACILNIDPTMNVSHDWSDEECVTILRGVRDVLKPSSRVLIRA